MRGFEDRRSQKNFLAADGSHRAPCRSGVGFDVLQVLMAIAGRGLTDVISDLRSAGHRLGGDARGAGRGDITAAARRTAGTSGRRGRRGRGGRRRYGRGRSSWRGGAGWKREREEVLGGK